MVFYIVSIRKKALQSNFCFQSFFGSINFHKTFWTFFCPSYELLLFYFCNLHRHCHPHCVQNELLPHSLIPPITVSLGFFFSRNNVHKILWIFIVRPKKFFFPLRLLLLRASLLAALHGWKSKSIFLIFSLHSWEKKFLSVRRFSLREDPFPLLCRGELFLLLLLSLPFNLSAEDRMKIYLFAFRN